MANSSLSIILIPGSWHQSFHYDNLTEALREKGYRVICHTMPTMQSLGKAYQDDVAFARHLAEREIAAGRTVDIIAHSYGGIMAALAFQGLGLKSRAAEGNTGGIRNYLGIASYLSASAESPEALGHPFPIPDWVEYNIGEQGPISSTMKDPKYQFFNDIDADIDIDWALKMFVPQSFVTQDSKEPTPTSVCWAEYSKLYYLNCAKDRALVPDLQLASAKNLEEKLGIKVEVTRFDGGHDAQYSSQTADWALKIVSQ